jgi:hypothetical protein
MADSAYARQVQDATSRTCAWRVRWVDSPDASRDCVLVLDESAFARLPRPVAHPERVVLIVRKGPQLLAQAWEAGIVSVVSEEDPLNTVLLAIMAAALRGISPNPGAAPAPIAPTNRTSGSKRCKSE